MTKTMVSEEQKIAETLIWALARYDEIKEYATNQKDACRDIYADEMEHLKDVICLLSHNISKDHLAKIIAKRSAKNG